MVSTDWERAPALSRVKQGNLYGYIDVEGNIKIPLSFTDADHFSERLASVRGSFGQDYIDTDGKPTGIGRDYQTHRLFRFSDGLAMVLNRSGKFCVINRAEDFVDALNP